VSAVHTAPVHVHSAALTAVLIESTKSGELAQAVSGLNLSDLATIVSFVVDHSLVPA
jgi:hypothetical protein